MTLLRALGCRTFTYIHLDASLLALWKYVQQQGLGGLWAAWPRPTADAWTHIVAFGLLEAVLQLLLPGKQHKGPVTPKGNQPVYKVTVLQADTRQSMEASLAQACWTPCSTRQRTGSLGLPQLRIAHSMAVGPFKYRCGSSCIGETAMLMIVLMKSCSVCVACLV